MILRILVIFILMIQTSFGVSIVLDGSKTILSGTDCSTATYRFGTTTSYNGENLDIILEVTDEDNDYIGGSCVDTQDGVVSFHIRDADYYENVASMDLKFTVVKRGTTTPVLVDMLTVTNFDLDNSPGATLTDDVYYKNPLQTLISNDSEVLMQNDIFYSQYSVKLRGKNTGNCNDSATLTELSCRAGAIWKNTSSIFARVQNDDAYGRYSINGYPTAHRLIQFSFEYEDIAPLINDNNDTKDCGVYSYSLNGSQWVEGDSHSQYDNNLDIQKTISIPNASQLKISFSGETEDSYDYLYIIDEDGNQHSYDGNLNNQNDLIIDGSLVTLKFTSDGWVEEEGVTVTVESLGCNDDYDFGDAPNQYTHVSHKISSDLYLGNSVPDEEDEQQSTNNATGDGDDDSDGVTNLPTLKVGDSLYSVPVKVYNHTGETAYITAWIDFNRNGTFEYEEALNTNNLQIQSSSNPQTVNVEWSNNFENQLANISAGKAIMRIRLTTSRVLRCDDPHYKENGDYQENYLVSPDGEVEDYEITIEPPAPDVVKPCSTIYYSTVTNAWVEGSTPVEYRNNLDISKTIQMDGTDSLRITVNGEIEHGNGHDYDWIYIYDEDGNELYKDDGNLDNTPFIVQGNKVTIKLHSDGGATEIGATVKIEGIGCEEEGECTENPKTVEVSVSSDNDDAEERVSNGDIDRGSSDLEMTQESHKQIVGIRFRDIYLPKEVTITNAYIQFTADETDSENTNLTIHGEKSINSQSFSHSDYDISSRTKTNAFASWSPQAWNSTNEQGEKQRTTQLKSIIQEIVNQEGWSRNSAITFIISGTGKRVADSYDGSSSHAPILHIEYNDCSTPIENNSTAMCYALTDDSNKLYKVAMNPNGDYLPTASTVNISTNFNGEGSAYRASDNKFYAFKGVSDDEGPSDLYTIDIDTGATIKIVDDIIAGSVDGAEFYFNPTLNKEILYIISGEYNSKLYAFNPDDWSLLAGYPKNTHTDLSSLAINPINGVAYAIDDYNYDDNEPKVYKLNLATGATTHITTLQNLADAEGLAFASDGNLYIEDEGRDDLDGKRLYMVNLQTGELTPSAITNSNGDIEGLSCNGTQIAINNPTVSLDGNNSVLEGDDNTTDLVFPITLSKPAVDDIVLHYEITDINTTANEDYILDNNLTVLIPKDANSSSIVVKVKGDTDVESDENLSLKLVDATNAIVDSSSVMGTIINDDELAPSLIAEYRFDKCNFNGLTVEDSSGNNFHGTVTGDVETSSEAKVVRSGHFKGGAVDANLSGLNSTTNGAKTTVSFWMNWNGSEASGGGQNWGQIPISWGEGSDSYNLHIDVLRPNEDTTLQIGFNTHNADNYGVDVEQYAHGWHHIVAIFNNGNVEGSKLYIDGVEQLLHSTPGRTPINSRAHVRDKLRIGGVKNSNQPYAFKDYLDEIKIYKGELNSTQITQIYNNENIGKNWDGTTRESVVCEEDMQPFICNETLYLSNRTELGTGSGDSGATWLHSFYAIGATYAPIGDGFTSGDGGYNAIGYNVQDNFIYALYGNHLLKIDRNANVKDLGEVTDLPNTQLYAGEFDRDGFYYVSSNGNADNKMYKIDITQKKVVKTITLSQSVRFWDMAIDTTGEYFYTMLIQNNEDNSSFENNKFAKIKISDGTVTTVGSSHSDLSSYISLIFSDAEGKIIALSQDGKLYEIMPQSGKLYFTRPFAPLSYYNDGASCPDANITLPPHPPRLSINNVIQLEGNSGETTFNFTVTADKPFDMMPMSGAMFYYRVVDGDGDEVVPPHEVALSSDHDFEPKNGIGIGMNMFGNGVSINLPVTVYGDEKIEKDEEFYVEIYSPQLPPMMNPKYVIDKNIGIGVIVNDDYPRFNIERTGLDSTPSTTQDEQDAKESFYTQIAGRDFDYTIVSYDNNSSGFNEFEVEDMTMKIELIDNNSTIDNDVIYTFYTYLGAKASRFDITNQDAHMLELNASRDVQFKISYLEHNSSILHGEFTKEQFESNQSSIRSIKARDRFAIRPAGFVEELYAYERDYSNFVHISTNNESVEVASGYPYELNVTALDFNHQISYRYNTSAKKYQNGEPRDVRFQEVNATLVFDDDMRCADSDNVELKNYYEFRNGRKSDSNFKHKNVGKYRVEVKDNNWTNIDHYYTTEARRGCVVGESFISSASNQMSGCNIDSNITFNGRDYHHMKLSFEPYSFDLSNLTLTNLASANHPDYLYMGDLEQSDKMAIEIAGEIVAKEKGGETTTNFTKECHAKEVVLSLEYNGTSQQGDFNNTEFVQLKTVKDTDVKSQRIIKYNDGTVPLTEEERLKDISNMTIDANITISPTRFIDDNEGVSFIKVLYNIQKNLSEEINPVEIEFKSMKADAKEAHSLIAWRSKVNGVEDRDEEFIPKGSTDLNSTKLFYFSRIAPDKIDYDYTLSSAISTPISVEIYCDINQTWCNEMRVTQGNGRNGIHSSNYWYTAIKHDSDHDGDVEIRQKEEKNDFNTKLNMAETNLEDLPNFNQGERGRQERLKTRYKGNTSEIPANEPVKIEMTITPDSWLKYYRIPDRDGNPYYHLIFMSVPPGSHTGVGRTGNILNIKANSNVNRKMDW